MISWNLFHHPKRFLFVYSVSLFLFLGLGLLFPSSSASAFSVNTTWHVSKWENGYGSSGQYASDTSGIASGQVTPTATAYGSMLNGPISVKSFNVWFTFPSSFNLTGKSGAKFSLYVPLYPGGGSSTSWGCVPGASLNATLTGSGVSSNLVRTECRESTSDPNNITITLIADFYVYPASGSTFSSNPEINVLFNSNQPFIIYSNVHSNVTNGTYLYFPRSVNIYNEQLYTDSTSAGINQMVGLQSQTNSLLQQQIDAQQQANDQQQEQYESEKQEESDREQAAADAQTGTFLGSLSNLLFPFTNFFNMLGGQSCFTPTKINSWLHTTGAQYCPWFSTDVTNTVSTVLGAFSTIIIFGFIIKWLNRSEVN